MAKWLTKILPVLLLLALGVVYFDFGSVKKIETGSSNIGPGAEPQIVYSPDVDEAKLKSRLAIGERYATSADLEADQRAVGYLKVGYFGENWPAKVAEISSDQDSITFIRNDGTTHNYNGFDGYRMKVVRLKTGSLETIVVFRSEEKSD